MKTALQRWTAIFVIIGGACVAPLISVEEVRPTGAQNVTPRELTVVSWNVENLFDTDNDPQNPADDAFTPRGWQRWTEKRYRTKLRHLAEVLSELGGDIVCLQEVENRQVLEDLAAVLQQHYGVDYRHIVHREGTDHRGIEVAILAKFPPATARWVAPVPDQRDILIAEFVVSGYSLTIFVNHWKSRIGPLEECTRMRLAQAGAVRAELDRIFTTNRHAAVIVLGDFNDDYDGAALVHRLQSIPDRQRVVEDQSARLLYNLHAGLPHDQRGTFYYHRGKTWNSFDSMSVSRSMLVGGEGWKVREATYQVVKPVNMTNAQAIPKPFRPLRGSKGCPSSYSEGYSDHFPVRVVLILSSDNAPPGQAARGRPQLSRLERFASSR